MSKKDNKIKVALIAPSMREIGGQSIQAKRLVDAFEGDANIEIELIPNNPENLFQNIKYLRTVFTSLKFWRSLSTQIPKFDVVQIFSSATTGYIIAALPPLLFSKFYGVKVLLNYHSGELARHIEDWKLTALPTMRKFDEIVVPSRFLVDVFERFGLKAQAIFNFSDSENFKFRERKRLRPIFLSNRNFEAHYQVSDILRAFQIVQKRFPEAKLLVAGYGSEEAKLKKLEKELKLANVDFVGKISHGEMPQLYNQADVYLNSSIVDNMPLSIIEAFSCGLPVVSTDAGGIPYIVEHEKTGLLVGKNDYKTLANEAIRLLENDDLAQKIINNARRECVKYACENVRREWLSIYRRLAE